eukprot:2950165-Prymnesium_polylepis.1
MSASWSGSEPRAGSSPTPLECCAAAAGYACSSAETTDTDERTRAAVCSGSRPLGSDGWRASHAWSRSRSRSALCLGRPASSSWPSER